MGGTPPPRGGIVGKNRSTRSKTTARSKTNARSKRVGPLGSNGVPLLWSHSDNLLCHDHSPLKSVSWWRWWLRPISQHGWINMFLPARVQFTFFLKYESTNFLLQALKLTSPGWYCLHLLLFLFISVTCFSFIETSVPKNSESWLMNKLNLVISIGGFPKEINILSSRSWM